MSGTGNGRLVLALGLVFLSLCSTGWAIQCYTCNNLSSSKCETTETCPAPTDACARITLPGGTSQYSCKVFSRCTHEIVSQEIGQQNFELKCCQTNLCNNGFMAHPSAVLLLSLAAALLLMMSSP